MSNRTALIALERGYTSLETVCVACGGSASREYLYGLDHGVCGICAEQIAEKWEMEMGAVFHGQSCIEPKHKSLPQDLRWKIFERDGFACCQCQTTGVELTIDHIKPRAKGGSDDEGNLQTLCRRCNASKGTRDA